MKKHPITDILRDSKWIICKILFSILVISFSLVGVASKIKDLIDLSPVYYSGYFFEQKVLNIALLICIFTIAVFYRSILAAKLSSNITLTLRNMAFRNLLKRKIVYYEIHNASQLQSNIIDDAGSVLIIVREVVSFLIRNIILLFASLILMYRQSSNLFYITFLALGFIVIPVYFVSNKYKGVNLDYNKLLDQIAKLLNEAINNIKLVYSYNLQDIKYNDFEKQNNILRNTYYRLSVLRTAIFSLAICAISLSITLVIYMGFKGIGKGHITAGELVGFMMYGVMFVSSFIGVINNIALAYPYMRKLQRLIDLIQYDEYESSNFEVNNFPERPNIKFNNVNFIYPSRREVCLKFDLEINYGEFVVIHGKSGTGKSTILQLLLKLYDPSSGAIEINGENLADISTNIVRNNIVLVTQEPLVFDLTILENITLQKPYIKEDLRSVLDICELSQMLRDIPLDTHVKNCNLSGGQKQRICLARSLLANPRILMLDEATNSLDKESEEQILQNIKNYMTGRTLIVVSHNPNIIVQADRAVKVSSLTNSIAKI